MNIDIAIDIAKKNAVDKIRVAFESAMRHYKGDREKEIIACFEEGIGELTDPEPAAKRLIQREFERLRVIAAFSHPIDGDLVKKQLLENLEKTKKNGNKR